MHSSQNVGKIIILFLAGIEEPFTVHSRKIKHDKASGAEGQTCAHQKTNMT